MYSILGDSISQAKSEIKTHKPGLSNCSLLIPHIIPVAKNFAGMNR